MIAHHGLALAAQAEASGLPLKFEAAVAGGIPVVKGLREGTAANELQRIYGMLNGTCNYILTAMEATGADFAEVLEEAQRLGDRRSVVQGTRVSVSVDYGGRRSIKHKKIPDSSYRSNKITK